MKCPTCGTKIGFMQMMSHRKMHKDEARQKEQQPVPPPAPSRRK